MASMRSRLSSWNPAIDPLCIHSQRWYRNGWQFVSWTAVPVEARTWAKKIPDRTWAASSRRLRSLQAGPMPRNSAGSATPGSYQPTPKPSPLVVVDAQAGVTALVDERVRGLVEQRAEQDRRAGEDHPTTHGRIVGRRGRGPGPLRRSCRERMLAAADLGRQPVGLKVLVVAAHAVIFREQDPTPSSNDLSPN